MKFACLAIAVVSSTACATNSSIVADTSTREIPEAIRAFEEVCLKTAPGFSTAADAAARLGMAELTDAGFMKMGFNKNQSVGVQIKENNECVMTTPSQRNGSLTRRFLQAIGQFSRTAPSTTVPAKATIGGEAFIFLHDRKGGEAFVMLKANRWRPLIAS